MWCCPGAKVNHRGVMQPRGGPRSTAAAGRTKLRATGMCVMPVGHKRFSTPILSVRACGVFRLADRGSVGRLVAERHCWGLQQLLRSLPALADVRTDPFGYLSRDPVALEAPGNLCLGHQRMAPARSYIHGLAPPTRLPRLEQGCPFASPVIRICGTARYLLVPVMDEYGSSIIAKLSLVRHSSYPYHAHSYRFHRTGTSTCFYKVKQR